MNMTPILCTLLVIVAPSLASPTCSSHDGSCSGCASAHTWISSDHCRFCPQDNNCHAEGSWFNPCSRSQNIVDPGVCADKPTPKPVVAPLVDNKFAEGVLSFIFKHLHITDVKPAACVNDVGGSFVLFTDFEADLKSKKFTAALVSLGRGISALSTAVSGCGVQEVQTKLDALAASVRWANISTASMDSAVKVIVGASDLWNDVAAIAAAVEARDPNQVGDKLNTLLDDWTTIVGGCKADQKACKFVDGLLRVIASVAKDVEPCEAALAPVLLEFSAGAKNFEAKHYEASVANFSAGLNVLAKATSEDSCNLKSIADTVGKLGPKLAAAVVKVESSEAVKIIVGSADVYQEIFSIVSDVTKGDYAGAGMQMGALLRKLQSSGCTNQACIVLEGIMATLQEGFVDFEGCKADIEKAWSQIEALVQALESKQWSSALTQFANVLDDLSTSVHGCGLANTGKILSDTAKKLHDDSIATAIGDVTQVLVSGADIMPDIAKIITDSQHENWEALGRDVGSLADWLSSTGCKSFVCRLIEGLLGEADKTLLDLKTCEATIREAEQDFTAGASLWGQGEPADAIKYWATGLNQVAKGVEACDVDGHLKFIEQEANVLGLGNVTFLDNAVAVLVHGADFYEDLYAALASFMRHDYRTAGSKFGIVMNDLSKWTTGHLCTSDICYVVSGVLQFLTDMKGDIKACGNDFKGAYGNFSSAVHELVVTKPKFHFTKSKTSIDKAIADIGKGLVSMADAVGACHMVELAAMINKLAVELGVVPEVKWVEELITILIKAVPIEHELANACQAWSNHNWPSFGYNLIMLIKTLVMPATKVVDIVV